MENYQDQIKEDLITYLEDNDITLKDFCRRIDFNQRTMNKFLNHPAKTGENTLIRIQMCIYGCLKYL